MANEKTTSVRQNSNGSRFVCGCVSFSYRQSWLCFEGTFDHTNLGSRTTWAIVVPNLCLYATFAGLSLQVRHPKEGNQSLLVIRKKETCWGTSSKQNGATEVPCACFCSWRKVLFWCHHSRTQFWGRLMFLAVVEGHTKKNSWQSLQMKKAKNVCALSSSLIVNAKSLLVGEVILKRWCIRLRMSKEG